MRLYRFEGRIAVDLFRDLATVCVAGLGWRGDRVALEFLCGNVAGETGPAT
ncbi:hypothetical protein [Actinomadura luteofluorescens]|uniref:hypothetical protein n=1 Tax=Actinomadura luteofluorescens TaxID=46163 RepID=UPI003D922401